MPSAFSLPRATEPPSAEHISNLEYMLAQTAKRASDDLPAALDRLEKLSANFVRHCQSERRHRFYFALTSGLAFMGAVGVLAFMPASLMAAVSFLGSAIYSGTAAFIALSVPSPQTPSHPLFNMYHAFKTGVWHTTVKGEENMDDASRRRLLALSRKLGFPDNTKLVHQIWAEKKAAVLEKETVDEKLIAPPQSPAIIGEKTACVRAAHVMAAAPAPAAAPVSQQNTKPSAPVVRIRL